jgi:outer membrane receptor protein involved in Fe transport
MQRLKRLGGPRVFAIGAIVIPLGLLLPAGAFAQSADQSASQGVTSQSQGTQAGQAQGTSQQQMPPANEAQKPPADAQKPQEQPPRIETEVFVSAPRLDIPLKENPAATSVVGEPVLKTIPRAIGAEEVLQSVPGLKVDNQADGERVHLSIRGQGLLTERGIRGVTVLLDGLPLNDPTGFAPDLFDIDWAAVQRVEVLRGVASALYGGGSAGGVINVETRDGAAGSPTGQASLSLGQYNFWKPFAEAGGTSGDLNYRVSASLNRGDGYRLHANFDAYNLYGKFRWTPSSNTQMTFIVAGTHYKNGNAEGLNLNWANPLLGQGVEWARQANPDSLTFNEYQLTNRITTGVSGRTKLAPNQDLSFALYYRRTYWTESVPSSVNHRTYDTPGGNVQYTMHSTYDQVKNHLSLGSDISWQGFNDYRYANLGNAVEGPDLLSNQTISQRGIGVYALDRVEVGPRWGLMMGLRADSIDNELTDLLKTGGVDLSGDRSFSKATGRVGVSFNPRADVGLYASWGQGFLPPATEELANNPDSLGGFNVHLTPATSQGEEFGVRGGTKGFSYDVGFFHLTTDNDFGRYRVASRPLETFYGNLGASRRYGLETEIGYYPAAKVAIRGAYTFSDYLYTSIQSLFGNFTDKVMPNSPRHQVSLDFEYKVDAHWVAGANVFGQSMQYVDQTNVPSADGFTLFNPRVAYRWEGKGYQGEIMLQARNLFGQQYIAFTEPDPDGNSYQPGPTRETFVTFRILFGGK